MDGARPLPVGDWKSDASEEGDRTLRRGYRKTSAGWECVDGPRKGGGVSGTENDLYILTIDLGTSGPKVALFTVEGRMVDAEFEPTELLLFPDGGAEQRPEDWWRALTTAVRRLLERKPVPVDTIAAVSCTGQWSGTVAVDRAGDPLMNAVIWMDSRGEPGIRKISTGIVRIEGYGITKLQRWLRLTGGAPSPSGKDPLAHILYIKDALPDIYRSTYKFLEPKDYLNLRLTGRFAASHDSIALHWVTDNRNINAISYDDRLIALSTVSRDKFPELKRTVDILGPLTPQAADELGLKAAIPVITGTPDLQSAALGSGAVRDFEGHLYIGTSAWLTCHVPFKKTDIVHNMAALPSAIPGKYFVANEQETAGACLTFLRDNIFFHDDELMTGPAPDNAYRIFDAIAERTPPGSGGVIFTPWLYGERTPVENHTLRSGFFNQSLSTTREHLVRAVFEGVAFNSRWLLGAVEKFIGRPFPSLNMIGGGAHSAVWCQIHADVLNRTIRQMEDPLHANVRGAAYLASIALGHLTFDRIPEHARFQRAYTPRPEYRTLYDERFKEFLHIYRKNRSIHRRLNRRV